MFFIIESSWKYKFCTSAIVRGSAGVIVGEGANAGVN